MFFTKKKKVRLDDFQIDNCNIKWIDTHKHLGLIIQNKLNWSAHVNYITERANIVLHQCKNIVGKTWGLTPLHVKYIYCCIVRQILAYGIIVWAPALRFKTNIKKLEKPQISLNDFFVKYYDEYKTHDEKISEYYKLKERIIYFSIILGISGTIYYLYDK